MKTQDAVESFRQALGLAPSEAAIYVHLCMAGPAKAGELATALKLHRNEVYRNTARLLGRGLVEMTMERPARYAAVRPEQVFEEEIASRLASVEELKAARASVTAMLASLSPPEAPGKRAVYKVIQGRQEIAAAQQHMLERAQQEIVWATSFPPSVRILDASGGLELLARRVDEGVRVRAAVKLTPATEALLKPLAQRRPGFELRDLELDGDIRFLITDHETLLMWVVNEATESLRAKDEVAIETTAPGFVQAESFFFEQIWTRPRQAPQGPAA